MVIVENKEDAKSFLSVIENQNIIILPTFIDIDRHYLNNSLSLIYVKVVGTGQEYVIGFDHPDLVSLPIGIFDHMKPKKIITITKKHLLPYMKSQNCQIISAALMYYLTFNVIPNFDESMSSVIFYQRKLHNVFNLNKVIPATKHIESHQINSERIENVMPKLKSYPMYADFEKTSYRLESTGITVDKSVYSKFYPNSTEYVNSDGSIYSYYNFYTSTGRPSNTFGGVNLAAINKNDGARRSFIPRNDFFLLFDFDSFHLNLIAKIIGYKFPEDNVHNYLGKYYFEKDKLTDAEYNDSKKKNFFYLYNGVPRNIREEIPYFKQVYDLVYTIWNEIKENGKFKSLYTDRYIYYDQIESPTPSKVFNYFIQLMETEVNFIIMQKMLDYLDSKKTKLVLYNYDSFLFDYSKEDGKECILKIKELLSEFPTKAYIGNNFHDMKDITEKMKII